MAAFPQSRTERNNSRLVSASLPERRQLRPRHSMPRTITSLVSRRHKKSDRSVDFRAEGTMLRLPKNDKPTLKSNSSVSPKHNSNMRPTANHNYHLRSRSPSDLKHLSTFDQDCKLSAVQSHHKRNSPSSTESCQRNRDSGIESAASTSSDSEDSNASSSEASVGASRSIPLSDTSAVLAASNVVPVISVKQTIANVDEEVQESGSFEEVAEVVSTTGTFACTVVTPADTLPRRAKEGTPQSCLQDIDAVINAGSHEESKVSDLPDLHCHSFPNESTSSSIIKQDVAVVQQECTTRTLDAGTTAYITRTVTTRYLYTASVGELEFVTEIFRGVQRVTPAVRTPALLPPKTRSCPKFTLILDLDETLVHCFTNDPPASYDHYFTVQVPDVSGMGDHAELAVFARLRPFVKEFLVRMASRFEVVVFTASMKSYSSKMLDLLDPDGSLIKYRFYRDHCIPVGCSFVKDLSIFARDLSKVIIVDNQIASFALQIENGIPIRSWIGDDDDRELLILAEFLEAIVEDEEVDVRNVIRESLKIDRQLQNHLDMYYSHSQHLRSIPAAYNMSSPVSPLFSCFTLTGNPSSSVIIDDSEMEAAYS